MVQFSTLTSRLSMKYTLLLFFAFSLHSFAQVRLPTNEVGQVQYQELVKLPDSKRPARQIMEQTQAWSEQHFSDVPTTEQQHDQQNNILFIKSSYPINSQTVRYTLTIEAKFGRYRATITDLIAEGDGLTLPVQASSSTANEINRSAGGATASKTLVEQTAKQQADLYRQIDKSCRDTLASLKQTLTGK
ncbi:hypothetical protein [Spirosoma pollinicola]|nr:hypothetical protein [Spirosoma pollinicola]